MCVSIIYSKPQVKINCFFVFGVVLSIYNYIYIFVVKYLVIFSEMVFKIIEDGYNL